MNYETAAPMHFKRYEFAKQFCKGKRVLDAACGDGYGSRMLAEVAEFVVGVDGDDYKIHLANRAKLPKTQYVVGDVRSLPFPDGFFDVVVSMETIEHFVEQDRFLDEIKRVLRPNGVAIISTPDKNVNMKMGTYHSRNRRGHGHPGELPFPEFKKLLESHFAKCEFFGQSFLLAEPSMKHGFVNLLKRIDFLHLRRIFNKRVRDKYNLSAKLVDWNPEVMPLRGEASQVMAVAHN